MLTPEVEVKLEAARSELPPLQLSLERVALAVVNDATKWPEFDQASEAMEAAQRRIFLLEQALYAAQEKDAAAKTAELATAEAERRKVREAATREALAARQEALKRFVEHFGEAAASYRRAIRETANAREAFGGDGALLDRESVTVEMAAEIYRLTVDLMTGEPEFPFIESVDSQRNPGRTKTLGQIFADADAEVLAAL